MSSVTQNPTISLEPNPFAPGIYYLADGTAIFACIGNPNGVIPANKRSLAISDDGNVYIKTTDLLSTGWTAIAGGGGSSPPFSDASALVKNGVDATKLAIFNAANISAATTRTYNLPNANGTLGLVNATSLFLPYNNAGGFADSPVKRTAVDAVRINDGVTDFVSLGNGGVQSFFDGSASFPAFNINSRGGFYGQASPLAVLLAIGASANQIWTATQQLSVSNGAVSTPAYSFNGFGNYGLWAAANQLSLSVVGAEVLRASNAGTGVTGLNVISNASGSGITVSAIGGSANENINYVPKGSTGKNIFGGNAAGIGFVDIQTNNFFPGLYAKPSAFSITGYVQFRDHNNTEVFTAYQSGGLSNAGCAYLASVQSAALLIGNTTQNNPSSALASSVTGTLTLVPITAPASPQNGNIWNDSGFNALSTRQAGLTQNLSGAIFSGTADKVVQNTVTETTLLPSGTGVNTIPANYMKAGKIIRLTLRGNWFTDAVAPSLNLRVRRNGATMTATGSLVCPINQLGEAWEIVVDIVCRTTGAGGTVQVMGSFRNMQDFTTRGMFMWDIGGATTNAFDTTIANAIDISAQWSAASASNIFTCQQFTIEALN